MSMKAVRISATLVLCCFFTTLFAQDEPAGTQGYFSVGVTMSDYSFSSFSKYTFGSHGSYGGQVTWWKPLVPHVDFSADLGFVLSNFPAGFVKNDSIGQAGVTLHADALIHLKAFARDARINPFLTAGAGWGSFAYQQAFYMPLGAGAAVHFGGGALVILQGQMRKALSNGINHDFMFYSAGIALHMPGSRKKKDENPERDDAAKDAIASSQTKTGDGSKSGVAGAGDSLRAPVQETDADADGDGIPDKLDKCPGIRGTAENDGCPFRLVPGADLVSMSADSVTYRIFFDFDRSELLNQDFSALNGIREILRSDKTLTINIRGYADMQGTPARNMKISGERADVTRDFFLSYGIPGSRITLSFYGSSQPVDEQQQWRNRRVDVTIFKH